ncbi:MAG: DUF3455 domain-containing protein [Terriglobales bacterium]
MMLFVALGAGPARPNTPEALKAPANEEVILATHGTGVQIYVCRAGMGQNPAWVLKAPDANLTDEAGNKVIHHFAGPTWKDVDGSVVTGKVITKLDAPDHDAVPWLLLSAASHTGEGILARVTTIQRIHTHGGLPPKAGECNASSNGREVRSAYSTEYYFYTSRKE